MLHDQREERDGAWIAPLQELSTSTSKYQVTNSHLSEYAVLGFELGYSLATHKQLGRWGKGGRGGRGGERSSFEQVLLTALFSKTVCWEA